MADADFANAGTWRPLACSGDAPSPRAYHSADACERGIIVYGGDVANLVDDAEARTVFLLDTARHRWERVQAAGEPPAGRQGSFYCKVTQNRHWARTTDRAGHFDVWKPLRILIWLEEHLQKFLTSID